MNASTQEDRGRAPQAPTETWKGTVDASDLQGSGTWKAVVDLAKTQNDGGPQQNHVEAWKGVIDFAKTITSIASAVLTGMIAFYVLDIASLRNDVANFVPPVLLIMTIIASMFGFGGAIRSISKGQSQKRGVLFVNLSVLLLVLGILSIAFIRLDRVDTLDRVIFLVERETSTLEFSFSAENLIAVEFSDGEYRLTYHDDQEQRHVTYSEPERRIVQLD